jgi:hypothetical protein
MYFGACLAQGHGAHFQKVKMLNQKDYGLAQLAS